MATRARGRRGRRSWFRCRPSYRRGGCHAKDRAHDTPGCGSDRHCGSWGGERVVLGGLAIFVTCPNCKNQLVPGEVSCRACRFDLIAGRQLGAAARGVRGPGKPVVIGGLLLAGGIMAAVLFFVRGTENEAPVRGDDHDCVGVLELLQPLLLAQQEVVESFPTCVFVAPGDAACWELAGVSEAALPSSPAVTLELRPMVNGFDLACRADLDGDGEPAVYKSTARASAVRITDPGIR